MSVYFSWLLFCLLPEWPGKFSLVQTSCHSCPRVWSMCFGKVIIYKSCAGLFSAEFQKQNRLSNKATYKHFQAATHLVPNPFDPRTSGPPLPVPMDKWSPNIWSPWTNGPQDNLSPWTIGPQNLSVVSKIRLEPFFQYFDIGWSTLDIMDDFKPISSSNLFTFR